jgi:hypothetical protein
MEEEAEDGEKYVLSSFVLRISVMASRRMRSAGHVACSEETRNAHKILVGKPEGKRSLADLGVDGRIILQWWEVVDWMRLAQDRNQFLAVVNTVMNLWFPQEAGNLSTS